MFNQELLRNYEVAKIIVIYDYANNIFAILQIMFSKLKSKHYRIKLFVMRVLANLKFFKFVVDERNRMLLRVLS